MSIPNEMYIDGHWVPASDGTRMEIIDPADEQVVDSVPVATVGDLDRALEAADRAWRTWREVDAWSRSAVLRRIAEILRERAPAIAEVLTEEQGKTLGEARGEILASADQFDWYADEARRIYGRLVDGHSRKVRMLVMRQPIGPVAAFTPWNFPALLPARKIAAAIAAGCAMVLKPAEEAPRTAMHLARACEDAGLPPGVLNVVTGVPAMISAHLIRSDVIRKVSFTGSVPIGKVILGLCAEGIKPASMELGGHSPVLVFADSDVEQAAEVCARGKFRNMGQVCIAASRFYVQESVADRFTRRFVEVARGLHIGNGRAPETDVGPLSNLRRVEAAESLVYDAVEKGATVVCGGGRPEGFPKGFYFSPTVISGVDTHMRLMMEEPFCPVAPIATFTDLDDALDKANATPYGLAGYVFTNDTRTMFLASEGLEVGMVGVNQLVIATAELPFGGVRQSGFGREGGAEGIEAYTVTKYVNLRL